MPTRREFLKLGGAAVAGYALTANGFVRLAFAEAAAAGLSDPAVQPKFVNLVPDALAPSFIYQPNPNGVYNIVVRQTSQMTGLVNKGGKQLSTTVWGYGTSDDFVSWPGRTFQVQSGDTVTKVKWDNQLYKNKRNLYPHLLPVDTSLHWAYSLGGYTQYSIEGNGVPIITHLHGGHSDYQFDGNPEFFYSPDYEIIGPQWTPLGGVIMEFQYDNNVPAGNLWYHDHALGITRLNVYAGMAGFYFVRDTVDTGLPDNALGLPAWPYEKAYAIQDRMFTDKGELFYPAYPGDPYYDDFIYGEGAELPPNIFPGGGPTALAEFFGDHMVVNGKIWPKEDVEPRNYRMHLLNGTDSRFMAIQFVAVPAGATNFDGASSPIDFTVIGSDQGLGRPSGSDAATVMNTLVSEPGGRYDIVFDFTGLQGMRVIMKNIGGDEPFGGDIPGPSLYADTDKIMAFDVADVPDQSDDFDPGAIPVYAGVGGEDNTRRVALFEGTDEYGRLQPLLGTVANDLSSATAYAWHLPTTETPEVNTTEIWEIYNFTGDAHPIHLHLVKFQILGRNSITFDSDDGDPGTPVLQHNGMYGKVPTITDIEEGDPVELGPEDGYFESAPKDIVTALPEQVTRIKATFDKTGRYVWHCHILSHEDHEMMRVLQVLPAP